MLLIIDLLRTIRIFILCNLGLLFFNHHLTTKSYQLRQVAYFVDLTKDSISKK